MSFEIGECFGAFEKSNTAISFPVFRKPALLTGFLDSLAAIHFLVQFERLRDGFDSHTTQGVKECIFC